MPDLQSELSKVMPKHDRLLKLIWEYVREHPYTTNKKLAEVFGKVHGEMAVSKNTYDAIARAMLCVEKRRMPGVPKAVNFYYINPRMQGKYELWDRPVKPKSQKPEEKKAQPQKAVEATPVEIRPADGLQKLVKELGEVDMQELVDNMPVGLAKQLHTKLSFLFRS